MTSCQHVLLLMYYCLLCSVSSVLVDVSIVMLYYVVCVVYVVCLASL